MQRKEQKHNSESKFQSNKCRSRAMCVAKVEAIEWQRIAHGNKLQFPIPILECFHICNTINLLLAIKFCNSFTHPTTKTRPEKRMKRRFILFWKSPIKNTKINCNTKHNQKRKEHKQRTSSQCALVINCLTRGKNLR